MVPEHCTGAPWPNGGPCSHAGPRASGKRMREFSEASESILERSFVLPQWLSGYTFRSPTLLRPTSSRPWGTPAARARARRPCTFCFRSAAITMPFAPRAVWFRLAPPSWSQMATFVVLKCPVGGLKFRARMTCLTSTEDFLPCSQREGSGVLWPAYVATPLL